MHHDLVVSSGALEYEQVHGPSNFFEGMIYQALAPSATSIRVRDTQIANHHSMDTIYMCVVWTPM